MPMHGEEAVSLFSTRFEAAGGRVHLSDDPADIPSLLKEMLESMPRDIHITEEVKSLVGKGLTAEGISTAVERDASDFTVPGTGITVAAFGIASTGSLVEVAYDERSRLASAATRVHIALLDRSCILHDLGELAGVVREKLSVQNKPVITLIGGPSRTSDIELKDVVGVHGPDEVHVLIYGRRATDES